MKKTLRIINVLLAIFLLPLLTSWLFDWHWISQHWTRKSMVVLLMASEIAIGAVILKLIVKNK